jgi:hypothetical protein
MAGETMPRIRNLTLHRQGEREREIALAAGLALDADPEGVEATDDIEAAAESLAALLRDCAARGHAALAHGHTGVWIAATVGMARAGEPMPALYSFLTERLHDERGRFVFAPVRLVRVA